MTKTHEEYYTVTTMKISTRIAAYIFNAIIICFCALTIASYFFAPAMNYGAKVVTTPELTNELKTVLITEDSSPDSSQTGEINENEVIADVLDQLGKDKVTLTFSIKATTPQLFALLFNKAETEAAIKRVINANVSTVLDEMSGSIDVVVENLSKSMLRLSVKSALSDTINDFISNEELSDKTVDTVLNDLGLTDEYLDEKSGMIFEAIKADGATVDTVTDATIAVIDEVVNDLASSTTGEYENLTIENLPDSVKETIKSSIKSIIGGFADKNGNINPDSIIYNVLGRALDKSSSTTPTEGEETAAIKTALFADGEKTYTKEDVEKLITDKINAFFTGSVISAISTNITLLTLGMALSFALWGWLVIKIVIKLFAENPTIKVWSAIWLGSSPVTSLFITPAVAGLALSNLASAPAFITNALTKILPANVYNVLTAASKSISVTVNSTTMYTAIITAIFIVFSIFYMIFRKKLKKEIG